MFGISPQVHDLVFSIGALVLLWGLIPQIMSRVILPVKSCIAIGGTLLVFSLNYLTMEYWYVMVVEFLNVVGWIILLSRALQARTGEV
jgi:hypothetical protein